MLTWRWRPWKDAVVSGTTPFIWVSDKYKAVYFENPKACSTTVKIILKTHPNKIGYHRVAGGPDLGEYNFARFFCYSQCDQKIPCESPIAFENVFKDYFKFGFVRNPYDRCASTYKMCIREAGLGEGGGYTEALGWAIKSYGRKKLDRSHRWLHDGLKQDALKYGKDTPDNFKEYFHKTIIQGRHDKDRMARPLINHHWAPQIHFVPSDRVKLDFIGRFENFEEDFRFVLNKIGFRHDDEIPKLNTTKASKYVDYFDHIDQEKMIFFHDHYYEDFEHFNYKRSLEC